MAMTREEMIDEAVRCTIPRDALRYWERLLGHQWRLRRIQRAVWAKAQVIAAREVC